MDDHTLAMTVYGCLSEEDTSGRIDCCGIFRSTDGGESWGDFSLVAYDEEFHEIAYNEMDIQPMPDGAWVALIRTEWRSHHGGESSSSSVCFSRDLGYTWTRPEFAFIGAVPTLALLPDWRVGMCHVLPYAASQLRWRVLLEPGTARPHDAVPRCRIMGYRPYVRLRFVAKPRSLHLPPRPSMTVITKRRPPGPKKQISGRLSCHRINTCV